MRIGWAALRQGRRRYELRSAAQRQPCRYARTGHVVEAARRAVTAFEPQPIARGDLRGEQPVVASGRGAIGERASIEAGGRRRGCQWAEGEQLVVEELARAHVPRYLNVVEEERNVGTEPSEAEAIVQRERVRAGAQAAVVRVHRLTRVEACAIRRRAQGGRALARGRVDDAIYIPCDVGVRGAPSGN